VKWLRSLTHGSIFLPGTSLPIPLDPAVEPPSISMGNNFSVDNLITGSMAPAMLSNGYTNVSRSELYRSSCTQPAVSQPYPSTTALPQTVFPAGGVPDDMYTRASWYNPPEAAQVSPLEYQQQQQQRYDNRSPNQLTQQAFRPDAYKSYSNTYDCKY